jgi:asparagine synthase (glutamine-hydrolysing)
MSGLCGLLNFDGPPVETGTLSAMAQASSFRGPDGLGCHSLGPARFAALALHATYEAAADPQPLLSSDGTLLLVADARLDNLADLKHLLRDDPELQRALPGEAALILAAYNRWGLACVERLVGDFAFALWDQKEQRLFAARDPLGVKPFHYARTGRLIAFASDAQQILAHPAIDRELDPVSIGRYLAGYPDDLERTYFQAIRRLPPGHRLVVTSTATRRERFWDVDPDRRIVYRRDTDYADHFRELLERAVTDRLRSAGTAVGLSLSGGLDSSSLAALAAPRLGTGAVRLVACTFVFERLAKCDERSYSQALADALGFENLLLDAEQHWLLENLNEDQPDLETPFSGWQACTREMYRLLRERGTRVHLTGHGADDLLTGSGLAYADLLRDGDVRAVAQAWGHARAIQRPVGRALYRWLVEPLLPTRLATSVRGLTGTARRPSTPSWIEPELARRAGLDALGSESRKPRFRQASRQELYDTMLRSAAFSRAVSWHDRMGSAEGIEVRHPFLDSRVIEYVFALPPGRLVGREGRKALLRRAMQGRLPDFVRLRRDKTRFGPFIDVTLREKGADRIAELLHRPLMVKMGILRNDQLRSAYKAYQSGDLTHRKLWYAFTLETWLRRCARATTQHHLNTPAAA